MEPLSIKCCELVCFHFLFSFFSFFSFLLFLTVVLFSYRRKPCIVFYFVLGFFQPKASVGSNGCKTCWKPVITWKQCPHESQEKGLYKGKSRTSRKTHTREKQLIVFFSLSLFWFPIHSPGSHGSVCMSTWLTAALWAVGELSVS